MSSFKPLAVYYLMTLKLKDVTDDKRWPFSPPQFTASSIFIPDRWGLKCCINGRGAVQHYERTGVYVQDFFFHSLSSPREVTQCRSVFILSSFVWAGGHERLYILDSICCQAYIMLFQITIILFLSSGWGDVTTRTKKPPQKKPYLECSHFEEWVPIVSCRLLCCPAETQRDVNCMACFPVCWHCGYHLFSSVSTNHLILLWPVALKIGWEKRGSTGLMWFWRWRTFSVALIALVFLVKPMITV